jgi:hypothetical protein
MTVLRRPGIVSVAALGGITLAIGVAHAVAPEWSRRTGLDVWSYPELSTREREVEDRRKELQGVHDQLRRQVEAADHVVSLLIDGELSLGDATDEILRINQGRNGFIDGLRSTYPEAHTDRQLTARYAIRKAAEQLEGDPSRQAEVLARLEAEYHRL